MKKIKKIINILLITLVIFGLSACGKISKEEGETEKDSTKEVDSSKEITIIDMTGREVTVKTPIKSFITNQWDFGEVVSLVVGEEYEDMLKAVGGSGSSEGFQRVYGNALPKLKDMTVISGGGKSGYDLETIIKIQPDVFLLNSRGSFLEKSKKDIEDLEKAGIPVVIFTLGEDAIKSPMEGIELLGELFDKKHRADEVNKFIQDQFDLVDEKLKNVEDRISIYYEHSNTADRNTYASTSIEGGWATIIDKAKGNNIAKDSIIENSQINPEYLLKTNPDVILFSTGLGYVTEETNKAPKLINEVSKRVGWDTLKAFDNKKVYGLFHDHSRSPFSFYPTLYLAKEFYPELMEDVNPDEILKEFYERFMLVDYEDGIWSYKLE